MAPIRKVATTEMDSVRGGSVWGKIKAAAGWVKDHIVITAKSIAYKVGF